MSCELCGGGDEWIKTCLTTEGSRLLVCDECYEEHAPVLVIVPGNRVVMARCDQCCATATPEDSLRSVLVGARTLTRGRALSAQRRDRDEAGGAVPASRLSARQERP